MNPSCPVDPGSMSSDSTTVQVDAGLGVPIPGRGTLVKRTYRFENYSLLPMKRMNDHRVRTVDPGRTSEEFLGR